MSAKPKDNQKTSPGDGRIHNSEEFADYVHAVSIPMKVAMAAIVVFFAGVIVYCALGSVPVTIDVAAIADDSGACTCYIKAEDINDVNPGDPVEIDGETYKIDNVSSNATCVDGTFDGYTCEIGDLEQGEYVFTATVDSSISQGTYKATLTLDHLQPLSTLLFS